MALSDIESKVEQSIFEMLRLVTVAEGYLPDITSGLYGNSGTGNTNWERACLDVIANKGFIVEVFGYSSPKEKGRVETPRITVISRRTKLGDVGNPVNPLIVAKAQNPTEYRAIRRPILSVNMQVDIELVASSSKQIRILNAIVNEALGTMAFIPFIGTEDKFFLRQFNYYDLLDPDSSLIVKAYSYEIKDLYLTNIKVVQEDVPKITEITVETKIGDTPTIDDPNLLIT